MAHLDGILHVPSPFQYRKLNAEPPVSRQGLSMSWITSLRHCLTNGYLGLQIWKSSRSQASNHTRLMLCRFQSQMDLGCWNKASEEPITRGKKHSAVSMLHSFRNFSSLGKSLNSIYPQKTNWNWGHREGSAAKNTYCSYHGIEVRFTAPTRQLITACNSSSKGANTLPWSSRLLDPHGAHKLRQSHTHAQK